MADGICGHPWVCLHVERSIPEHPWGAGTGKTFTMEKLVRQSHEAGRPVFLCAPYGEQARVALRDEAPRIEAAGHTEVARIFAQANTVDHLLIRAQHDPIPFRGADIFVDEAGLLDTPKALALVRLAERVDARVIFQGDTEQMAAVGRGQPIKLLQDELGLGMHVPRASISRRQLSVADKQLAADLSSGNDGRFAGAVQKMLDRGMIRETPPDAAIEKVAREIVEGRATGKEVVAVSSVHRINEALADRVHDLHVKKTGREGQTPLDVHVKRDLQPAELRSSQFYRVGDVVEYKQADAVMRAPVASVLANAVVVERNGEHRQVPLNQVRAAFDLSRVQRGPGEKLLLQEKIKQDDRIFEKGSRQTISHVSGGTVHFTSGLKLSVDDGRVRQGDCLTDYKAQGIKGAEVRGIEDNGSAMAMANKEAFHVKGTRYVQNLVLHVENKSLYVEAIQRTNVKFYALHLERLPIVPARAGIIPAPSVNKGKLLLAVRAWGKEFLPRMSAQKLAEQVRQHLARFHSLRPQVRETVVEQEKLTPAAQETPRQTPGERLTPSVEEMAQKLRQRRDESIAKKQKVAPQPQVRPKIDWNPVPSQRQGPRLGM